MRATDSISFVEANARIAQSNRDSVLVHLRVSDSDKIPPLQSYLQNASSVRVVITSTGANISSVVDSMRASAIEFLPQGRAVNGGHVANFAGLSAQLGQPLRDIERAVIEQTIANNNGSIPRAAKVLDVSPSTIYRKMESWRAKS